MLFHGTYKNNKFKMLLFKILFLLEEKQEGSFFTLFFILPTQWSS